MLLLTVIVFLLLSDRFLTVQNLLLDLSESYAVSGIFALGLFVVLVTGGIDISFAAVASVVRYLIATLATALRPGQPGGQYFAGVGDRRRARHGQPLLIYCLRIVSIIVTPSACRRCCSAC